MSAIRIFSRFADLLDSVTQSAFFRARANHTGTQTLSTISDAGNAASKDVGTATGTVAAGNDTRIVRSYQDLDRQSSDDIDGRILGLTASVATVNLFSTRDDANAVYVRNPACWAAGYNLTGVSVWNSESGVQKAGTLITPKHVLFANHFFPVNGTVLRFVTATNTVVSRTLVSSVQIGTTDVQVGTLDSDLPATVVPLPLSSIPVPLRPGTALLFTNRAKEARVSEVFASGGFNVTPATTPNRVPWTVNSGGGVAIVGDSGNPTFAILGGEPVCLFLFTGINDGIPLSLVIGGIRAALPTGYKVRTVAYPFLGSAAQVNTGTTIGSVPLVQPNGFLPPGVIPGSIGAITALAGVNGSTTSTGTGGIGGNVITPTIVAAGGLGGNTDGAGNGGNGGSAPIAILSATGGTGGNVVAGTFQAGAGGNVGSISLNGGNGGLSNGASGGNGGSAGNITLSGGRGGSGTSTNGNASGGGAGGGVGAVGGNAFVGNGTRGGGNGGFFLSNGANGSSSASGKNGGTINLSGGVTYPGGSIDLSGGANSVTLGTGEVGRMGIYVPVPTSSTPGAPGLWSSDDNFYYVYGATGWRKIATSSL